jgi:topoisomerase IA-like protein
MENKNNNIFLGKIEKSGCYVNNGKYGYFLTCGKKNYKIPEWLEPEEITLDMAKRLIEYKKKYQKNGLKRKPMKVKMKVIMKLQKIQLK